MLTNLDDMPGVEFVLDQEPPLVLEAIISSLRRRVDSPFLRRGELSDELFLCEELDAIFAHVSCRDGLYGRSLSFDLDEGIVDGLLEHS